MSYRILLPLDRKQPESTSFETIAATLAEAWNAEVLALNVLLPDEVDSGPPKMRVFDHAAEEGRYRYITTRADSVPDGILKVARRDGVDLILIPWVVPTRSLRNRLGRILDPVMEEAPCDVMLVKANRDDELVLRDEGVLPRILVPLGRRGPHGSAAIRQGAMLAQENQAALMLLNVVPPSTTEKEAAAAEQQLRELAKEAALPSEIEASLVVEVVRSRRPEEVIEKEARRSEFVILGASNDPLINQIRLGSLGERLAKGLGQPVLVVRKSQGIRHAWQQRLWRWVDTRLPNLTQDDRLDTYKRIRRGARPTTDFYLLLTCSVVIATMGLLLNSAAVIIGAMVVAPLMTPIVGVGLSVVMGDARLLRIAASTALKGVLLSVSVAALLARLAPLVLFTPEIQARIHPNLFDLTVALAAGVAGAYSLTRQNSSGALPGVAIAVALVPPLAVAGIALSTARWAAARGALLLFGTNLVAIAFAAAVIYVLFGFFPADAERPQRATLLRQGLGIILALLFLLTIPLTRSLAQVSSEGLIQRTLENTLRESVASSNMSLFSFDWSQPAHGPLQVQVIVYAAGEVTPGEQRRLQEQVKEAVGRPVALRLLVIPISELRGE